MLRNIFTLYILLLIVPLYSQSNYSAVYNGRAGINAVSDDVWSVTGNQAGLAYVNKSVGGLSYSNRFIKYNISTLGFSVAVPVYSGTLGLGVNQLRFNSFINRDYTISYGMLLTKRMCAGIGIVYKHISQGEYYGSINAMYISVGSMLNITDRTSLGVLFYNPTQIKLRYLSKEQLPFISAFAVKHIISNKINIYGQFDIAYKSRYILHMALEYKPTKSLIIRGGVKTNPGTYSIGIGYKIKGVVLDIAFVIHPVIGVYPEISMSVARL